MSNYADPSIPAFEFLSQDGAGSVVEMDVDGSETPVTFKWTFPTGIAHKQFCLTRVNFALMDGGVRLNRFGGVATLTNGLKIELFDTDDSVLYDYTRGFPIKYLGQFSNWAGTDSLIVATSGDDNWSCRWTLTKAGMGPVLFPAKDSV